MKLNQIVAQLYTLRDFCKTEEDLSNTLKKVREIGYQAVQISGIGPVPNEKVRDIAEREGLDIAATHVSFENMKNDFKGVVAQHKLWNCEYVGLGGMPAEYRKSKEGFVKFAGEMSEIAKNFKDEGLKFIYHNHKFEFEKFDGKVGLQILMDESDRGSFGFEIDTYWVQAGGANPVEWINKAGTRMEVVHFKDMAIVSDKQVYAEIGEGNLNWDEIIGACRKSGVKYFCVEQDLCLRDPFESMKMSFDFLSRKVI